MTLNYKYYLSILIFLNLVICGPVFAGSAYIWNINNSGFFDSTNQTYTILAGEVIVDLTMDTALCPTGLGHLASGMESVKKIKFLFESEVSGDHWLHISWNPGGSGKEQFEVYCNSSKISDSKLADAEEKPNLIIAENLKVSLKRGANQIELRKLSGDGLRFKYLFLSNSDKKPLIPLLKPNLKFPTLKAYEAECEESGIMLDSTTIRLFASKRKALEAAKVFGYLVRAYDELYLLVGIHPEYKLVIYHFPEGNENGWGGTSNCTIWYSYENLDLNSQKEWREYEVPHLSGYIEEMAHNFDSATGAQFGWEMIGWNMGVKVTERIGGNPVFSKHIEDTREKQKMTFERYVADGYVFPKDIAGNLSDRIHAHILWLCENKYGPDFWRDFFREIRKERASLKAAENIKDPDRRRNRKYQITVECFDQLNGLEFKKLLKDNQLSLTTAIKSLRPTEPDWDRKFLGQDERNKLLQPQ